jgi:hypothetical protein
MLTPPSPKLFSLPSFLKINKEHHGANCGSPGFFLKKFKKSSPTLNTFIACLSLPTIWLECFG